MKLIDPATGKEIVGGLKQIKVEGKPDKIQIDSNCLIAQKRRPWIPNFDKLLISPLTTNQYYKKFMVTKLDENEVSQKLQTATEIYGEKSQITQELKRQLEQIKKSQDVHGCNPDKDWYTPTKYFWAAICNKKYPPTQKGDIYTIRTTERINGEMIKGRYRFYVGNLLKDNTCLLQNEEIFEKEKAYMKTLHKSFEEKLDEIKKIKVKPLEIQFQKPGKTMVFFRAKAAEDIHNSLDKILKTKIEEKVTEGSEDEEIDMWTRLKPDPRNLEKAQKIEEAIFNTNPTVEEYYKHVGKIIVLLDILNYESAKYSIVFRQRMQMNIYKPADILLLTFDELFPTEADNDDLKKIFEKDIDSLCY